MRLTLRTMLAYLDDILEPDDSADLGKKIEESEFATGLVQRTRECMRRVRLGAPPAMGKGMALDPNTVAEYLDNTLAAERVPEFEKICLESDMHLAEVASCHQILTLVLGEPADVDPESRQRMYHIAAEAEPQAPPVATGPGAEPPVASRPPDVPAGVRRKRPEVPDYLREPRRRLWPVAAAIVLAALLTFGLLVIAGPPELRESILAFTGRSDADTNSPAHRGEARKDATDGTEAPLFRPTPAEAPTKRATQAAATTKDGAAAKPEIPADRTPATTPRETPRDLTAPPAAVSPVPAPSVTESAPAPGADGVGSEKPTASAALPGEVPAVSPEVAPAASLDKQPEAPTASELGRYLGDKDVLLAFNEQSKAWRRIAPRETLMADELYLTLPLSRTKINLSSGTVLEQVGPALISLEGTDANNVPTVSVGYGRLLMLPVGKLGTRVRLHFGDRQGLITLGDADSVVAIDVRRMLPIGADPEAAPGIIAADLYATSGQVNWEENGVSKEARAPGRLQLTDIAVQETKEGELPQWVTSASRNKLDENATTTLEQELAVERPITLSLKELAGHRQVEVRSLAIRSCAHLGVFEPAIAALSDETQRAERTGWPAYIETFRSEMARGPEVAAQVRMAFQKKHGEVEGRDLYRMLWGYTEEDLKNGGAAQLVKHLNNDKLDFQVVSAWNLQTITGKSFRPDSSAARRRPNVMRWSERLRNGEIVPTPSRKPVPAKPAIKQPTERRP